MELDNIKNINVPKGWQKIRILTANLGNINLGSRHHYNNKLCDKRLEETIIKNIQKINPDVVFFQELLHPDQCEGWSEQNSKKSCFKCIEQNLFYQPRRLLGKNFSIVCASRPQQKTGKCVGMECIAVNNEIGNIELCKPKELCFNIGQQDIVLPNCNTDFIIHSVVSTLKGVRIKLINAHPHSLDKSCRNFAIQQIFAGTDNAPPLANEKYNLIAGDFNFDPFRDKDKFVDSWDNFVSLRRNAGKYYYHSGTEENSPPYLTVKNLLKRGTVDHVLSNFALGTCVTLGEAPNTTRLDGGHGTDHRALVGDLWIPPE